MSTTTLLTHTENGICTLTLNRPEKFNSFNREMALAVQAALDEAHNNDDIRCVVLTGAGKAFCAGQDLAEATDPQGPELEDIVAQHYNPIILRIRQLEKPVIAVVNGVAAGAGANIALACDIVLAAQSAAFIQAFSKIGLIPDSGGTYFLPRLIGLQRAAALMMTGDKITAAEAEQMGMIYRAVPDAQLAPIAAELATTLAQMPTVALGLTKRALNKTFQHTLQAQLELEKDMQTKAGTTEDFKEGVNAFLEKRKPAFQGK